MESQYENEGLGSALATQSFKKPPGFIDFYRQPDGSSQALTPFDRKLMDEGEIEFGESRGKLIMGRQEQPSPIYGSMKMDNYIKDQQQPQLDSKVGEGGLLGGRDEGKKTQLLSAADKQVALKRRSIENNRQHAKAELKPSAFQTKTSLSNYPQLQQQNQQPQVKQINKNAKIERDPVMDQQYQLREQPQVKQIQSQQPFQTQPQRSLAKSQSQNRLMLSSPAEAMLASSAIKNGNANQLHHQPMNPSGIAEGESHYPEKGSFIKDQLLLSSRMSSHGQSQDPMYKQHLQYSSGPQGAHHNKAWQLKASGNQQNLILSRLSTNNCTFCNKTHGGQTTIMQPHHCSAIYCSKDQQGLMIQNNLSKKYSTNRDYYNLKIVNDLIYNENTHIVSIFKDYLILDDINEFLKRYYSQPETKVRLPKLCSFYDKYSQVFPNYVVLPESKYMFKNIQRKQKLIDEQYQLQEHLANKQHLTLADEDKLFNTKFYNSYYSMGGQNDMSMSKKQYEEQAKQIAVYAGRKVAVDQMKMDELVDRFLMRDSESNIQLLTEGGLDFSGVTHQSSTFFNQQQHLFDKPIATVPAKVTTAAANNKQVVQQLQQAKTQAKPAGPQQLNQIQVLSQQQQRSQQNHQQMSSTNTNNSKKPNQNANHYQQLGSQSQKRQKVSFNNTQGATRPVVQKVDALKIATVQNTGNGGGSSNKNTPRITQGKPYQEEQQLKQHSSPATKEALHSYLQGCQLGELQHESPGSVSLKQKALMATASQTSLHSNQVMLSSQSLNAHRNGLRSQQALLVPQNQITNLKKTNRLSNGGGAQVKPKTQLGGPVNQISSGGFGPSKASLSQQQHHTQQQQQQHYGLSNSRNQPIGNNSTQKSTKSVNSHAKYLSGGNEQYQKLLAGMSGAAGGSLTQQQQQAYLTHFESMNALTAGAGSSSKKPALLAQQRSKGDLETYLVSGVGGMTQQSSNGKDQPFSAGGCIGTCSDQQQQDIVTGEDCDDFGIADERFASPEAKLVFSTIDDAAAAYQAGRKSLEGATLLCSSEDKILNQCNNFDQIKKHLEQYITINQQTTFESIPNTSGKKQQYLNVGYTSSGQVYNQQHVNSGIQINTLLSGGNLGMGGTSESGEFSSKNGIIAFNRDHHLTSSTSGNMNSNTQGGPQDSRNSQKHFESLKQKIRGVFDHGSVAGVNSNTEATQQSASKTPVKSQQLSHSKKSMIANSNSVLNQNRMSIESKNGPGTGLVSNENHLMMMLGTGQGVQSTQAHRGGQLQFAQSSFSSANNTNNGTNNNYRSITNIQQRKTSKPQLESSIENKRLSSGTTTQNRQSFRDINVQQQQQQFSQTGTHLQAMSLEQQQKMKRCATGKTLTINDINQQTFGGNGVGTGSGTYAQSQQQIQQHHNTLNQQISQAMSNPNFMSHNSASQQHQQKLNNLASIQNPSAFNHQQAQQAANTVRVMTPSYSLASLSKIISPTQQQSPLTMTVSIANTASQSRKQVGNSSHNKSKPQQYQTNSGGTGTYLLSEKQTKVVKSNAHKASTGQSKIASPALTSSSSSTLNIQTSLAQQNAQSKLAGGRAGAASNGNGLGSPVPQHAQLSQSNSLQVFQVTPRGVLGASVHQQQQELQRINRAVGGANNLLESSQNLSCTLSTDPNSSSQPHPLINIAAKAIESKNPKFMRTIEETGGSQQQTTYNTMLSASLGHRKSGTGLTMSVSQAQFELQKKAQLKVQTVVSGSMQSQSIKRASAGGNSQTMTHSLSVQQFKSPQQTVGLQSKKHTATVNRYPGGGGLSGSTGPSMAPHSNI